MCLFLSVKLRQGRNFHDSETRKVVTIMRYNPNVYVVENANSNNCSEAAVRKYIKVHCIDRRYEQKVGIVNEIRKSIQDNPSVPLRS